ncbi:MAG: hypothetical protein JSW66_05670 [Phycisphaerales bacterium]|nr:MAG: hypothetical protein JSW66_05670 [Phycisphaerales bacterium]
MKIVQEAAALNVTFVKPEALAITTHEGSEPPPEKESPTQHYAITATAEPVAETGYLAVLTPTRMGDTRPTAIVPLSSGISPGLRININGTETLVAFRKDRTPIMLKGITTEGPLLALRLDKQGRPCAVLQVE